MWFESWFDTSYYHLLYGNRSDAEASLFMENLVQQLQPPPQSVMLDLACGKGRHSRFLAKKGYKVTGLDLSANSIADASKNALPGLRFNVHDMRDSFGVNEYNYIFNLFTSFGYFDNPNDDNMVLNNVYEALLPHGYFIQDYFNCTRFEPVVSQVEKGGLAFNIKKYLKDGFIIKEITFEDAGVKHNYTEKIKHYTLDKLLSLHIGCGLKPLKYFGNYQLEPFVESKSDRIIIISQKV